MQTYFVEWVGQQAQPINATLTFEARNAQGMLSSDSVTFYRFQTTVIVIGGNTQEWTLDENEARQNGTGIFLLGWHLYAQEGYDVHPFAEPEQRANPRNPNAPEVGRGLAYDEVRSAILERRVENVVAMGFSYGGGAVFNLMNRIDRAARGQIAGEQINARFSVPFTGYIDAIVHDSRPPVAVTQLPARTAFHVNYYQQIDNTFVFTGIRGAPVQGSNINVDVNAQPWEGNINHTAIDDNLVVLGLDPQQNQRNEPGIRGHLLQQARTRSAKARRDS